jgi:hypothetical protein
MHGPSPKAPEPRCIWRGEPLENQRGHMDQSFLSAVPQPRPMSSPECPLPETPERRCPVCESQQIVHAGHVIGGGGMLESEQRCVACRAAFWFVRKRTPVAAIPYAPSSSCDDAAPLGRRGRQALPDAAVSEVRARESGSTVTE